VADPQGSTSSTSRTTNYEISKTINKIINPVGTIQDLSVSILVADKVVPATEDTPASISPRTAEELQSIETMVAAALGIDLERGDQISVTSMPFSEAPEEIMIAEAPPSNLLYEYLPFVKLGLVAAGALLTYLLLVRPIVKTMKGEIKEHYKTVETLEQEQRAQERALEMEQRAAEEKITEDPVAVIRRSILENPTPAAHILKNWLQEA